MCSGGALAGHVEKRLAARGHGPPTSSATPRRSAIAVQGGGRFDHADAYLRDEATGDYNRLDENKCPIKRIETLSAIATSDDADVSQIAVVGAADLSVACSPAAYCCEWTDEASGWPGLLPIVDEGDGHWGVLAAGTFGGSIVRLDGSSVAAPQLARKIADDLERRGSANFHPLDTADGDLTPVPPREAARLGTLLFRRPAEDRIPRRRYPAVES